MKKTGSSFKGKPVQTTSVQKSLLELEKDINMRRKRGKSTSRGISSKIESMFRSEDVEMRKLGQKLCHVHRIDYYILVETKFVYASPSSTGVRGYKMDRKRTVVLHSIDKSKLEKAKHPYLINDVYCIDLTGLGKALRRYNEAKKIVGRDKWLKSWDTSRREQDKLRVRNFRK